jgi:hypothetical protein
MDSYRVRASSIAAFFDCPLRWATIHLDGVTSPASSAARIGTAVHRSTAAYDQAKLDGEEPTIEDTADVVLDTIRDPDEEVDWGGMPERKAVAIGIGCHTKYCSEIAPTADYEYVEQGLDDLAITIPVAGTGPVEIVLTGTLDRIRREAIGGNVHHGICDVKTGARAASAVPGRHKAQLGVYELLADQSLGIQADLNAQIIGLQTSSRYDAVIHEVAGAREALLGSPDEPGLLTFMASMLKRGIFYGNASSFLCSEKYCPNHESCKFR